MNHLDEKETTKEVLFAGAAEIKITPPAIGTFMIGPLDTSIGVHGRW